MNVVTVLVCLTCLAGGLLSATVEDRDRDQETGVVEEGTGGRQLGITIHDDDIKKKKKKKKKKHKISLLTRTTRTETSSVVVTSTTTTIGLCAKLVNVTGACRRRRGAWLQSPIVMTFDDDLDDEMIDDAFSPTKTFRYFLGQI